MRDGYEGHVANIFPMAFVHYISWLMISWEGYEGIIVVRV